MKYLKSFETMQFAVLKNAKDIADKEKERRDKKKEQEAHASLLIGNYQKNGKIGLNRKDPI